MPQRDRKDALMRERYDSMTDDERLLRMQQQALVLARQTQPNPAADRQRLYRQRRRELEAPLKRAQAIRDEYALRAWEAKRAARARRCISRAEN